MTNNGGHTTLRVMDHLMADKMHKAATASHNIVNMTQGVANMTLPRMYAP